MQRFTSTICSLIKEHRNIDDCPRGGKRLKYKSRTPINNLIVEMIEKFSKQLDDSDDSPTRETILYFKNYLNRVCTLIRQENVQPDIYIGLIKDSSLMDANELAITENLAELAKQIASSVAFFHKQEMEKQIFKEVDEYLNYTVLQKLFAPRTNANSFIAYDNSNYFLNITKFDFKRNEINAADIFFVFVHDVFRKILALKHQPSYFLMINEPKIEFKILNLVDHGFASILNDKAKDLAGMVQEQVIKYCLKTYPGKSNKTLYLEKLKSILFANILVRLRANSNLITIPCVISMLKERELINEHLYKNNFAPAFDAYIEKHESISKTYFVNKADRTLIYSRAENMQLKTDAHSFTTDSIGTNHFKYALGI